MNSTKYSIIHTLRKFGQRNEQIWVNLVIVMNKKYGKLVIVSSKFTAKYGGYCQKLEKNMVELSPKTYNQTKNVSVIHENI